MVVDPKPVEYAAQEFAGVSAGMVDFIALGSMWADEGVPISGDATSVWSALEDFGVIPDGCFLHESA